MKDADQIQHSVDTVGKIILDARTYDLGEQSINITRNNVQIIGQGADFDDTSGTDAPTLINYSGSDSAFNLTAFGTVLRYFGIGGTGRGKSGICLKYDAAANTFPARTLIENISVKGFSTGAGIMCEFGVSTTLRRINVSENLIGCWIKAGTVYNLDGVLCRTNSAYGLEADSFNGLFIHGGSVFESNMSSGLLCLLNDDAFNLDIRDSWFENNNRVVTGTHSQIYTTARGSFALKNVNISLCNFADGQGDGDGFIDHAYSVEVSHIRGKKFTKGSNTDFQP